MRPCEHLGLDRSRSNARACTRCLGCVDCCTDPAQDVPLTAEDVVSAVTRWFRYGTGHFPKDAKGNPLHDLNTAEGAATRFTIESVIIDAHDERHAAAELLRRVDRGGGGRLGDSAIWEPKRWNNYHAAWRRGDFSNDRKSDVSAPGLWIEAAHHRAGLVSPLEIVRLVRARPVRTYAHLGCGGVFRTAFPENGCPYWGCSDCETLRHPGDDPETEYGLFDVDDDDGEEPVAPIQREAPAAMRTNHGQLGLFG